MAMALAVLPRSRAFFFHESFCHLAVDRFPAPKPIHRKSLIFLPAGYQLDRAGACPCIHNGYAPVDMAGWILCIQKIILTPSD